MTLLVVIEESEDGFAAHIPALPGCVAAADTLTETTELIAEAAVAHMELMKEQGLPAPTLEGEPPAISLERYIVLDPTRVSVVIDEHDIDILYNESDDVYAARWRRLGLTAYGRTEPEAVEAVHRLCRKMVQTCHADGQLARRLDDLGVTWRWRFLIASWQSLPDVNQPAKRPVVVDLVAPI